jgi:hypothetical protein
VYWKSLCGIKSILNVKLVSAAMLCRNLKELRELICLSRLDYNRDEDILDTSDSDDPSVSPKFQAEYGSDIRPQSHRCRNHYSGNMETPDSGIDQGTSFGSSCSEVDESLNSRGSSMHWRHLGKGHGSRSSTSSCRVSNVLPSLRPLTPIRAASPLPDASNRCSPLEFEFMFNSIDTGIVSDWLQEANDVVAKLSNWNKVSENFVSFAHFWLSQISGSDRLSLIRLEYGILLDQLAAAFPSEFPVKSHHIRALAEAVFHEFPRRILSTGGIHLVLSHLDILMLSQRDSQFCKLLSDIHCSTNCRQHTEIVLAMRAFAITSMLSAFVNFYCKLHDSQEVICTMDMFDDNNCTSADVDDRKVLDQQRIFLAIR